MKKVLFILVLFLLFNNSCGHRKKFELIREDYLGDNIRLDGFYYNKPELTHFFLYRNGIMYSSDNTDENFNDLLDYYKNPENYNNVYNLPYYWGVFQIDNKDIKFETWVSGDAFGGYSTRQFDGRIINDTTLIINDQGGSNTFYFHKFSPKPDSTNTFIE